MNLHQLRVFLYAARYLNFSHASEELGMSQPTVSVHIRKLETELGLELIEQIGKSLYLTEPGRRLMEYADRIFALERDAEMMLSNYRGLNGCLRIGVSSDLGTYYVPKLLVDFCQLIPALNVTMKVGNTKWVKEHILKNTVDMAVVSGELPSPAQFDVIPFLHDELVVIAAPNHPLAGKTLGASDLFGQPFILRERDSNTRTVFQHAMLDRNLQFHVLMELENTEAIKRLISSGAGLGVVTKLALDWEISANRLVILNVADLHLGRDSFIVWYKDKKPTRSMQAFTDFVCRYASNH